MRIMISYQVDTVDEAKEVMAAVENRGKLTTFRVQDEPAKVLSAFDEASVERKNVTPGQVTTTKIGTKTTDWVLKELTVTDRTPEHFGTKNLANLALLWSRGVIKFDGTLFYLP